MSRWGSIFQLRDEEGGGLQPFGSPSIHRCSCGAVLVIGCHGAGEGGCIERAYSSFPYFHEKVPETCQKKSPTYGNISDRVPTIN